MIDFRNTERTPMNRFFLILLMTIGLLNARDLYGQKSVVIAESTLKMSPLKEEIFYYGFAAGDKLVFNFEEQNNKELKEIEIMELPSSSKFVDSKVRKIENKTINIVNTGIYKFRFTNGILPRVCKFTIQRIPASTSTQNFNTTVYTRTVSDTIYTTDDEQYIDRSDTAITNFQDRVVKLQPTPDGTGNKSIFSFTLPENTIAWSYYFYTDDAGKKIFEDAAKNITPITRPSFNNYGPLGAEILGSNSFLKKLTTGKEIAYWIVEGENSALFLSGAQFRYIKKGSAVNDYSKIDQQKGNLYFCFSNAASTQPATITVKITALHINEVLKIKKTQQILSIRPKTEMYLKN